MEKLNSADIRAKYWRMKTLIQERKISPTVDREIAMLQVELQAEIAAQLCETNDILKRTIGLMNVEELMLEVGRMLAEKRKEQS